MRIGLITAPKRAEAALRESRRRIEWLLDSVEGIIWEADPQTFRFTYVSQMAERLLGYPVAQWSGPTFWFDHVHPDDRDWAFAYCQSMTDAGKLHDFEYRMLAADGRVVWLRDIVSVEVVDGQPVTSRGIMVDITERKQAEAAVRETETRFRTMADGAPVMIWMAGEDAQCTYFNRPWLAFTGRALEQEVGTGWADGVHPEDLERCLAVYGAAFNAREQFQMEYRLRRADGEYRWILDTGVPRRTPGGAFEGYIGSCIDIHEHHLSQEALRASHRQVQELAGRLITAQETERSRIARELHDDLSQRLAALALGHSALKRRLPPDRSDLHDELTRLQQQAVSLADAIHQISHELHPGILQQAGLVAALQAHCAEFGRQQQVEVAFRSPVDLNGVPAAVALCLYRVAQEALQNIAAHAQARRVEVALQCTGTGVELVIRDNGRGFGPEAAGQGGLGLISMDERVRLVDGTVQISSQKEQGTEVRVRVPLDRSFAPS